MVSTRTPRRVRPGSAASSHRAAPILARHVRGEIVESVHRGHIVQVDATGSVIRLAGDPEVVVALRSCVKPFALVALLEAGGVREFDLSPAELAVMASSHSGEDLHVRTLQAVFRRAGVSQTLLACGTDGAPLDALTAMRLARDGEKPGPVRHNCSGMHAAQLLLARVADWTLDDYWQPDHPVQVAVRAVVARVFATAPERLVTATDQCGVDTYGFPLRAVAAAYALLAGPDALPAADPRRTLSAPLRIIRDAMLANPEQVAGTRDRLDTSLMKARPGRLVVKGGAEALRGIAILADRASGTPASAFAIKVEDGGGFERAAWSITVEALRLAGILGGQSLRALARYHRPVQLDPHGKIAAETIPEFDLVPVGELIG
jgi:L-asparaginase II